MALKRTPLPSATYNKILIFDVHHELTYKKEIFEDCKNPSLPPASIFIEEILPQASKKTKLATTHSLLEEEFKKYYLDNGLSIKREQITFDSGNNKYIKLFECILPYELRTSNSQIRAISEICGKVLLYFLLQRCGRRGSLRASRGKKIIPNR
ncbi:MAG: hypothetical protein IPP79_21435 [Chitinophagaceae bacterium]|nr:hypothetical protein [Chitinophagaceae bacterium]